MSFTVVIPARYSSSRLPAKPLKDIAGKIMVQRVYEQAVNSGAGRVIVATDDQRIAQAVEKFGGEVCMTSDQHQSGTDRLQEVVTQLQLPDDHIVVNVQGDEPLIPPQVIDQVAGNLSNNTEASVATLCEPISSTSDFMNPNIVKVVRGESGMALYFSRAPIPWPRDTFASSTELLPAEPLFYRHIGIYGYRVELLHEFVGWEPAPLEKMESLEQLRVLSHGRMIHVDEACAAVPGGVDTMYDLERVRALLA